MSDYDFETCKELVPMQTVDIPITYAEILQLEFKPSTTLRNYIQKS